MIREHDAVVLTVDLSEYVLARGDAGTVVLVHAAGGYEVEFMTLDGETVSLSADQVRESRPGTLQRTIWSSGSSAEWLLVQGTW